MAETENKSIDEIIETLVNQPRAVSTDGGSVTNINIQDAIEADKYLEKKKSSAAGGFGFRIGVIRGPGHF